MNSFSGFPKQSFRFFRELSANNNRPWFLDHREEYEKNVLEPGAAFVRALGTRLQTLENNIHFDTRTNGTGSIKRIHRDLRFSRDKTPYKTKLGIIFWQGNKKKKSENPVFWFHLDAKGAILFGGMYEFSKPMLRAYREAAADEKVGGELQSVLDTINKKGKYELGGQNFKRIPSGYDPSHPRENLLRYNALYATSPRIDQTTAASDALVDVCFKYSKVIAPLNSWLSKINESVLE